MSAVTTWEVQVSVFFTGKIKIKSGYTTESYDKKESIQKKYFLSGTKDEAENREYDKKQMKLQLLSYLKDQNLVICFLEQTHFSA